MDILSSPLNLIKPLSESIIKIIKWGNIYVWNIAVLPELTTIPLKY